MNTGFEMVTVIADRRYVNKDEVNDAIRENQCTAALMMKSVRGLTEVAGRIR